MQGISTSTSKTNSALRQTDNGNPDLKKCIKAALTFLREISRTISVCKLIVTLTVRLETMYFQLIIFCIVYFINFEIGASTNPSVSNDRNFIFDKFGSSNGLNRTQLQNLMRDLGIGQANKNLEPQVNKVGYFFNNFLTTF